VTRGKTGRFAFLALSGLLLVFMLLAGRAPQPKAEVAAPPGEHVVPDDTIRTEFADYIWPTDAGKIITSTFAEFRKTHFHGGIDIGTGNQTGYRVFAARDGYVSRIRVSPTGYGKMLYVRHADGYTSTYAHLEKFNALLETRVRIAQNLHERYAVDVTCSPEEFPVSKGDIIAYTGETGVGTPHLHFEIRDENMDMINPLLCDHLNAADNIHPTIRKIAVKPLGERSTADGSWQTRVYTVQQVTQSRFRIRETIQATGEVGFAIDVVDRSNGSRFRHGVYKNEFFMDDSLIYTVQLDRAPSEDAHQIRLYYDWALYAQGRGRFQRLYVDSPNRLRFYQPKGTRSGIVGGRSYAQGPHKFRILSTDFNKNTSEVTGTIIFNHPPEFIMNASGDELMLRFEGGKLPAKIHMYTGRTGSGQWTLKTIKPDNTMDGTSISVALPKGKYDVVKMVAENAWGTKSSPRFHFLKAPVGPQGSVSLEHEFGDGFVRIVVKTNGVFTSVPAVSVYEGESRRHIAVNALDIDTYAGTFQPLPFFQGTRRIVVEGLVNGMGTQGLDEFNIYPISPGAAGTIAFDNGNFQLSYDSASVFKPLLLRIEKETVEDDVTYHLLPNGVVLDKGFTVRVRTEERKNGRALFYDEGNQLNVIGTYEDSDTLTGRVMRILGSVAVLTDVTPPSISRLSISQGSRPTISFRYGDDLSGVEYNEFKMYIDGAVVIPEIDGEHRRAIYRVSDPLARGSHHLTIRIKDKMGNTGEVEHGFIVR
jgi:hypothetical protein